MPASHKLVSLMYIGNPGLINETLRICNGKNCAKINVVFYILVSACVFVFAFCFLTPTPPLSLVLVFAFCFSSPPPLSIFPSSFFFTPFVNIYTSAHRLREECCCRVVDFVIRRPAEKARNIGSYAPASFALHAACHFKVLDFHCAPFHIFSSCLLIFLFTGYNRQDLQGPFVHMYAALSLTSSYLRHQAIYLLTIVLK